MPVQEEIKNRLKLGNACYHLVQNLLSSSLPFKHTWNYNLPVVFYGCEIWLLTLREEHRLRVFENGLLRRRYGPKGIK